MINDQMKSIPYMIQMKIITTISLIMAVALTMNVISAQENTIERIIEPKNILAKSVNNLKISNYTGSGITPDMVSTFIKFINDIYEFQGDNPFDNADYLQNKLQGTYTGKFQVLIYPQNSTADLSVYSTLNGTAYVAWTNVNTQQPLWTYIIIIITTTPLFHTQIDGYYDRGDGVSFSLQQVIEKTISRYETGTSCKCYTSSVQGQLEKYDGQRWNVVCTAPRGGINVGFSGIIYQKDDIYEQTVEWTAGKCRYLVWVI